MRVLVTGSRNWSNVDIIWNRLSYYAAKAAEVGEDLIVVHGSCYPPHAPDGGRPLMSADYIAEKWTKQLGHPCRVRSERYPADWNTYGKQAGFVRNAYMVELNIDICLAFVDSCINPKCTKAKPHVSHGTDMCVKLAKGKKIPVEEYLSSGL